MKSKCLILTSVLTLLMSLGLGERHLWQDEVETAERARTILESGLPKVVDAAGQISVNSGGLELEEGILHRYTPWGQFYWGAWGLALGQILNWSDDFSIRFPSAFAHGATSGLIAYTLMSVLKVSPGVSYVAATFYSFQSIRIVHNRTSRYHALLDLLTALGFFVLCVLLYQQNTKYLWLLQSCFFLLPHTHSLGGAALACTLGLPGAFLLWEKRQNKEILKGLLILFIAAILLAVLTRPWIHRGWGGLSVMDFRSISDSLAIKYSLVFSVLCLIWSLIEKKWRKSFLIGFFLLGAIATTGILDIYSYSQTRYYLPLSTLALFWTYAVLIQEYSVKQRKFWSVLLLLFILLPDVYLGARRKDGPFPPFQGLQVIYHDFQTGFLKTQGLHQAFEEISKDPQKHPVLVDYVPQFANWYVPGFPIALMPDATSKTKLNSENPIWNQDRSAFFWHVAYLDLPMRLWNCSNHCDYQIENLNLEAKTYELRIHSQQKSIAMCIVKRWKSTLWVNAPFRLLTPSAFEATGNGENLLGLSRPCHAD